MSSFWNYPLKFRAMPDPRIDELIRRDSDFQQRMILFMDDMTNEIAELHVHVTEIRAGITSIQARLDAALASSGAGGTVDPAKSAEIHAINEDLRAIVASMNAGPAPVPVAPPMPAPDPVPVPEPAPAPTPDPLPASLTP